MKNDSFLMLISEKLLFKMMPFIRQNDEVLIFKPENFLEVYMSIFDECSIADASVDDDGSLGQG